MKSLYDNTPGKELTACQKNTDEQVFSALVRFHYEELYKYAVKFTKSADSAKDEVNEFFILVWEKRSLFFAAEHPKNYLLSSFKNFLSRRLASLQRDKNRQLMYISGLEDKELPYEDYILASQEENDLKQSLQAAINRLPARHKELVQLKFYEHLSYEEIATKTSLETRTVYNKLHEAIKRLRTSDVIRHLKKSVLFFL